MASRASKRVLRLGLPSLPSTLQSLNHLVLSDGSKILFSCQPAINANGTAFGWQTIFFKLAKTSFVISLHLASLYFGSVLFVMLTLTNICWISFYQECIKRKHVHEFDDSKKCQLQILRRQQQQRAHEISLRSSCGYIFDEIPVLRRMSCFL